MLLAWDMFTDRLRGIRLDIPESGGPLPDFLAEVKWEIDWLLKMQAEDGRIYHKLSAINFCGFIMPDEEKDPRYFSPWSSAATADFAAMCAMSARIFAPFDAAYAERCLTSAVRAYDFLLTHPENHAGDLSAFTTGGYTTDDRDDRLWMAAELWDATGDGRYRVDFEQRLHGAEVTVDVDWDWGNVANLGLIRYLLSKRAKDQALTDAIADAVVKAGEAIVDARLANGYARPMGSRYYWGSNGTVARQAIVLSLANRLVRQGTESRYGGCDFVESGLDALAYLFGRNPYNRSFVTGLGQNPPLYPHDRRSGADGIVDPWPGYLVGGGWPGALDWKDEERSHETNEIAINWNSALIFALAWFVAA
jgi:endoglucanase